MTLVRYNPAWACSPWANLPRFQGRMNSFLDQFSAGDEEVAAVTWSPRVEIIEEDDRYEVTAELPGLDRKDVRVEVHNDTLTISGEKRSEREKKERNLHMSERVFGSFSRSFHLPSSTDAAKIDAQFKNGVLNLTIPKQEEAKARQVEIKVN